MIEQQTSPDALFFDLRESADKSAYIISLRHTKDGIQDCESLPKHKVKYTEISRYMDDFQKSLNMAGVL